MTPKLMIKIPENIDQPDGMNWAHILSVRTSSRYFINDLIPKVTIIVTPKMNEIANYQCAFVETKQGKSLVSQTVEISKQL